MGLFFRVLELLDDTEAVGHSKKDNVHLFGVLAAVFNLIAGGLLYIMMFGVDSAWYIKNMGLLWVFFACLDFYALYVFEHEDRQKGAKLLAFFGTLGFVLGVGFFVGSIIMMFAGVLAMKYSFKRMGKKIE